MIDKKNIKELIIGSEYSAWGYLLEAMKDFWMYDGIMVVCSRKRADIADTVISLIKLCGYQESEGNSNYEERKKVYKCKSCGKVSKIRTDSCKVCHISEFLEIQIMNHVTILEKVGMMKVFQAEQLSNEKVASSISYLQKQYEIENMRDEIIKKRWG